MGRFKAVIRLIRERLEASSLRKGIAALCILTAVAMFSFAAPFALNFSYAETIVDGQETSQNVVQSGEAEGAGNETQNNTGSTSNGATGEEGTAEGGEDPQAEANQKLADLIKQLRDISGVTVETSTGNNSISKITVIDNAGSALTLLSNSDASLYQNADIEITQAGQVGLISTDFEGLGSADNPYSGFLKSTVAFNINRPLFNAVKLGNDAVYSYTLNWGASNSKDAIFASKVLTQGVSTTPQLNLTIEANTQTIDSDKYIVINSPAIGEASGDIKLKVSYSPSANDKFKVGITSGADPANDEIGPDAGMLVNTYKDGSLEINLEGIRFDKVNINSERANAGLIVGRVFSTDEYKNNEKKTKILLNSKIDINESDSVEIIAKESAGGLIGHAEDSIIEINNNVNLSHASVRGLYSGGFVGSSIDSTYSISESANISSSLAVGGHEVSSQYAGGLFGVYETSSNIEFPIDKFDLTNAFTLEAKGQTAETGPPKGAAGGFAGKVVLNNGGSLKISMKNSAPLASEETNNSSLEGEGEAQTLSESENSSETNNSESMTSEPEGSGIIESITSLAEGSTRLQSVLSSASAVEAYGGVIGAVEGAETLGTNVKLENMTVLAESAKNSKALYKSGMVAIVGGVDKPTALVVSKMTAQMTNADSSDEKTGTFGGVAAKLGKGSVIYQAGETVVSTEGTPVNAGGGIVGIAEAGSAVRLKGTTDISGVNFNSTGTRIGQLVGVQDSALVYAEGSGSDAETGGWDYIRSGNAKFDDIGNYGQVYRLHSTESTPGLTPDLITMAGSGDNPTYKVGFSNKTAYPEGGVSLGSKDDLARLAITIQTRGHFSGYDGIDTRNWNGLLDDKLTVTSDINLAGTGVTGITRDSIGAEETPDAFTGSIDGGGHYIALSVGEAYGNEKGLIGSNPAASSDCCGKVYRHNRLGLFSYGNGSAVNLEISGNINFEALEAGIAAGAYSACSNGGDKNFKGCSFKPAITYKTEEKLCYVGGVIGMLDESAENNTTFTTSTTSTRVTTIAPEVKINAVSTKGEDITGGAIGYISGNCPAIVNAEDVVLGATISNIDNNNSTALAGGFIGVIQTSDQASTYDRVKVTFKKAVMDNHKVKLKAKDKAGGLLGYMWADTNVRFDSESESEYALSVKNESSANLIAESNYAGGLVYRAAGKWTVEKNGINLNGAKFTGTKDTLGLLVCRGVFYESEMISGQEKKPGAIYLEMTDTESLSIPDGSEMVDCPDTLKTFDELVAITKHTNRDKSFDNNFAGIISIKADNSGGVIKTYQNKTKLGKEKKTNEYSRYYYNLDSALTEVVKESNTTNNTVIDTPEELLIWSVAAYSATNLKSYFTSEVSDIRSAGGDTVIGQNDVSSSAEASQEGETGNSSSTSTTSSELILNMAGYSYYPVTVNNRNITIKNVRIKFNNKEQEGYTNSTRINSQHCAMQCGLFCDFSSTAGKNYSIDCSNIAFEGSVGLYRRSSSPMSGVLISGIVKGNQQASNTYYCKVNITNCELDGIVVCGFNQDEYAPLLLKDANSFTEISIDELSTTTKYQDSGSYIKAGTSLLGNIGDANATLLSVTFSRISLPSKKIEGGSIFTRASLLNRFSYTSNNGVATATYNFTEKDKEDGKVTFGAEIDGTKEYVGEQLYFYKTQTNTTDGTITTNVNSAVFLKDYLPYVYVSYNTTNNTHEIEVNHSFSDIVEGCGTYYDPYVVDEFSKLKTIARLIRNGKTGDNQSVTIAKNQKNACKRKTEPDKKLDYEVTYKYKKGKWINVGDETETIDREVIQRYMQSAYIDICPSRKELKLVNFEGLGNMANPFRGVIISSNKTIIEMNIDGKSCQGFIPYSYGSVVKDISFKYSGTNNISYTTPSAYTPTSFFGGVIGIIMGGDNIIENVSISADNNCLNVTGTSAHKIPMGGYVGVVSGGGVIFRGENVGALADGWFSSSSVKLSAGSDAYKSLYVNPVIGRVISGYAFSEGVVLDNTDKNYKINSISVESEKPIQTTTVKKAGNGPMTTTVKSAQGLLILSAIIQSGAAGGPADTSNQPNFYATNSYYGQNIEFKSNTGTSYRFGNANLGKVRNATYKYVGNPADDSGSNDFNTSVTDDMYAPGQRKSDDSTDYGSSEIAFNDITVDSKLNPNTPYLITKYATKQTQYICGFGISLAKFKFEDKVYDMRGYGNAYVGLSGRYKSNSCASLNSDAIDRVVPYVICVDGNNATIKVSMNVREYSDDDFQCSGAGALFSSMYWMYSSTTAYTSFGNNGNNAIKDLTIDNSYISVDYYSNAGQRTTINFAETDNKASVGGVAGRIAHVSNGFNRYPVLTMENVSVSDSIIEAPISAGSLIGETGYRGKSFSTKYNSIGSDNSSSNNKLSFHLLNCSYSNNKVTAGQYAGGFIGRTNGYNNSYTPGSGISVTSNDLVCGSSSSIEAQSYAGGIVGVLDGPGKFVVNDPTYKITDNGGNNEYYSNNSKSLQTAKFEDVRVSATGGVSGGLIGKASSYVSVNDSEVRKQKDRVIIKFETINGTIEEPIEMTGNYVGGLVGTIGNTPVAETKNNIINKCTVEGLNITTNNSGTGGLVGIISDNSSTTSYETLNITDSIVKGCTFGSSSITTGDFTSGGAIGIIHDKNIPTKLKNFASINNTIEGKNSSSFVGIGRGNIEGCNVLIKNNIFDKKRDDQGLVAGSVVDGGTVQIAGLSIKKTGDSNKDIDTLYGDGKTPGSSYLAFADYNGKAAPSVNKALLDADENWPYVTTSPVTDYYVKSSAETAEKYLFGDGIGSVDDGGKAHSTAQKIVSEAVSESSTGLYKYTNASSYSMNFEQQISTYNENNADKIGKDKDLPVLTITGGNATVIEDYLNIVSNGGYKAAKELNSVNATVKTYEWNKTESAFIMSGIQPSILVNKTGSSIKGFSATADYDNNQNRIQLLTVTFSEAGGEYKIHVPIIVKRIFEVDSTVTLNYGTVFKQSVYDALGKSAHILESFGNPVTALITYKYNSAIGERTEYGWDTYMQAGGSLKAAEKTIEFKGNDSALPGGTKLSLVDCGTGKVYTYTTPEDKKTSSVSLSSFKDSDGKSYNNKWMSQLMSIEGKPDNNGIWVKCEDDEVATAVDSLGMKFRLATGEDSAKQKYNLISDKETLNGSNVEMQAEENFFLTINIPYQTNQDASANGYIEANVQSEGIPISVNSILRPLNQEKNTVLDDHDQTASTYSFLSGYSQTLVDETTDYKDGNKKQTPIQKGDNTPGRFININLKDTISFNSSQVYNANDKLFYRLDINLNQFSSNGASHTTSGFATTDTEGKVKFYVMVGDNYYKLNNGTWTVSQDKTAASVYDWKSTQDNRGEPKLVLKDNNGEAIDLSGIREIAKAKGAEFIIRTEMEVHMSEEATKKAIMSSLNSGNDAYTNLNYKGILSVRKEALDYSSNTESTTGKVDYYHSSWGYSTISYSANDIKQLGINCLDLETADGNIITTGMYSLEDRANAESIIEQADKIEYSLQLMKKNNDGVYELVVNPGEYVSVECSKLGDYKYNNNSFVWSDKKDEGLFKLAEDKSNKRFNISIHVKVNTSKTEFANYRLLLRAKMYDANNNPLDDPYRASLKGSNDNEISNEQANHCDYVTYTLTKIAIDGLIEESSN